MILFNLKSLVQYEYALNNMNSNVEIKEDYLVNNELKINKM